MRPDASKKIAKATPKSGPNVVLIGAVLAIVVVLAVVVAIVIGNNSKSGSNTAQSVPSGVVGGTGGGILVDPAAADAKVPTVDVYADFQCPICGQFEESFGSTLTEMAKAAQVKYVVHMMTFLDTNLGNDSSKRATNAAACAADAGKFGEYHSAVFAAQPAKEGDGYTDAQLTEFAKTAGITGPALTTWQQCTTSGQHDQYVTDVADASGRAGVTGTPTVFLNGKDITKTLTTPDALVATIKAAKS
ncbi:MAG: thioredoxin domain-containing protein [Actinomycetota bacterium]